jgi:hypothetical protein
VIRRHTIVSFIENAVKILNHNGGDQASSSSLVAGADAGAVVTVEILTRQSSSWQGHIGGGFQLLDSGLNCVVLRASRFSSTSYGLLTISIGDSLQE